MKQNMLSSAGIIAGILLILCSNHLSSMDPKKGLHPHDYQCPKGHQYNGKYPIKRNIWGAIKFEDLMTSLSEEEDRNFDQFEDGKGPLVIAYRPYNSTQELAASKQMIDQERMRLRQELGKAANNGQFLPDKNNELYQQLRARILNQPEDQIKIWEARLNQFPALWQALEKTALNANIAHNIQRGLFRNSLVRVFAEGLDLAVWGYTTPFADELNTKNTIIVQKDRDLGEKDAIIAQKVRDLDVQTEQKRQAEATAEAWQHQLAASTQERDQLEADYIALLNQADASIEVQRNRINRMSEELQQRRNQSPERRRQLEEKEQENARLRVQLESLHKQMAEHSTKSAEEYMSVRRQLSPMRQERDQLRAGLQGAQMAINHAKGCPILRAAKPD